MGKHPRKIAPEKPEENSSRKLYAKSLKMWLKVAFSRKVYIININGLRRRLQCSNIYRKREEAELVVATKCGLCVCVCV